MQNRDNKEKIKSITPREACFIFWLTTIGAFIFTLDTRDTTDPWSSFLITLFFLNIFLGVVFFIATLLSRFIHFHKKFFLKTFEIAAIYFICYVVIITLSGHGLVAAQIGIRPSGMVQQESQMITPIEIPISTNLPVPTTKAVYNDPDPIINCNYKYLGTQQIKRSLCNIQFECQVGDKWYFYTSREKCAEDQKKYNAIKYPPCTVYYKYSGESKTYNYMTPEQCSYWQQRASISSQPLSLPKFEITPFPTVEPYQYSQEYLDAIKKANQEINKDWQPSQFVPPTSTCYATWDDYFKAHPHAGDAPIYGVKQVGLPPCE